MIKNLPQIVLLNIVGLALFLSGYRNSCSYSGNNY